MRRLFRCLLAPISWVISDILRVFFWLPIHKCSTVYMIAEKVCLLHQLVRNVLTLFLGRRFYTWRLFSVTSLFPDSVPIDDRPIHLFPTMRIHYLTNQLACTLFEIVLTTMQHTSRKLLACLAESYLPPSFQPIYSIRLTTSESEVLSGFWPQTTWGQLAVMTLAQSLGPKKKE